MSLSKINNRDILNINKRDYLIKFNIEVFRYLEEEGNSFYVFTCEFDNDIDLRNFYSEINEIVALEFQSKLKKDIERWNIYIIYFTKTKISNQVKKLIEQDKYATRKIVVEKLKTNFKKDEKLEFITNRIFKLNLSTIEKKIEDKNKIEEIINNVDSNFGLLMEQLQGINRIKKNEKQKILEYLEVK